MLLAMALWELAAPRRKLTVRKGPRWFSNLALVAINAIVARVVTGFERGRDGAPCRGTWLEAAALRSTCLPLSRSSQASSSWIWSSGDTIVIYGTDNGPHMLPSAASAAAVRGEETLDISDGTRLLGYLFLYEAARRASTRRTPTARGASI